MSDYSTKKISKTLVSEITKALSGIDSYGSIEIYVQNGEVTQISVRNIKKTAPTNGKSQNHLTVVK